VKENQVIRIAGILFDLDISTDEFELSHGLISEKLRDLWEALLLNCNKES
jgi:hypothetical protein